jgi:uncharacterized coiled-coil DUF342 family protein
MQEADAVSASAPVTPVAEDATSKAAAPIALHSSHERTMATLDAMDAQVEASLAGLSAEKQVAELRAQLRAVEVKRREQVASLESASAGVRRELSAALAAADEVRKIAMRKGAEEMQKQLEPQFKQLLESHEEMKAERQKAAESAAEAWQRAKALAELRDEAAVKESKLRSELQAVQETAVDIRREVAVRSGAAVDGQVQELEEQLEESRAEYGELREECVELRGDRAEAREEIQRLESACEEAWAACSAMEEQLEESRAEYGELREECVHLRGEKAELAEELSAAAEAHEEHKEATEDHSRLDQALHDAWDALEAMELELEHERALHKRHEAALYDAWEACERFELDVAEEKCRAEAAEAEVQRHVNSSAHEAWLLKFSMAKYYAGDGAEPQLGMMYDGVLRGLQQEAAELEASFEDEVVLRLMAEGREKELSAALETAKSVAVEELAVLQAEARAASEKAALREAVMADELQSSEATLALSGKRIAELEAALEQAQQQQQQQQRHADEEEEEEEEEEEAAVDMGHRRQFVVAETESGTSAAAEPEPEIEPTQGKDSTGAVPAAAGGAGGEVRSKTPARPMKRSKTPQAPRAKTPSAPRAKTPAGTSP